MGIKINDSNLKLQLECPAIFHANNLVTLPLKVNNKRVWKPANKQCNFN